jgi:hypothetical protein
VKLNDQSYFCKEEKISTPEDRPRRVDAARVLEDLFSNFSETRVSYEKVKHGIALTEWLIRNAPEQLDDIVALLTKVLPN